MHEAAQPFMISVFFVHCIPTVNLYLTGLPCDHTGLESSALLRTSFLLDKCVLDVVGDNFLVVFPLDLWPLMLVLVWVVVWAKEWVALLVMV